MHLKKSLSFSCKYKEILSLSYEQTTLTHTQTSVAILSCMDSSMSSRIFCTFSSWQSSHSLRAFSTAAWISSDKFMSAAAFHWARPCWIRSSTSASILSWVCNSMLCSQFFCSWVIFSWISFSLASFHFCYGFKNYKINILTKEVNKYVCIDEAFIISGNK